MVYAVLLKPLPVSDPGRLVWIWANSPSRNVTPAYRTYAEWKAGSPSFESMSAYAPASAALLTGNDPERIDILRVNAAFFQMLGVEPATGRNFLAEEDRPGAPRVAILSYRLWERRFGRGDFTVRDVRLSLFVLFGAVGLLLLMACANVASLLLLRASSRQREIALRTTLGAGHWRILRQ